MKKEIRLSTLGKTWIFDLDGTLVEHNGYKSGEDKWLPGAKELLQKIPKEDYILILTAREKAAEEKTRSFFNQHGIRINDIKFEIPMGERLLFNDSKPSGLRMSYAVECKRNEGLEKIKIVIDKSL